MYFVIYVNRYSVLGVYILRCVFRGRLDNRYMCVEIRSPLQRAGYIDDSIVTIFSPIW